ncbi:MAG: DUF2993 domain-containing protein [Actinobacteria bacterium]|nr:DUF2993 domain-containing protein [Actinomycetota bacterium]MBW3646997.1 DUF2993 domain-containing protein [Actinomycetota bacterium]
MRRLLIFLIFLLVLAAVGDRVAAGFAARTVASKLQSAAGLPERPDVDIAGVPFLTQAVAGRYERVEVSADAVPAGELSFAELTATLTGVQVPLSDVRTGDVDEVPVDMVDAQILLAYDELSRRSGNRRLTVTSAGDRVRVTGSVQVLGRTVEATAISALTVEGEDLVVTAESFEVGNDAADAAVTRALRGRLDLRIPAGGLPYDLMLRGVEVEPGGVALRATARDVVLSAPP